MSHQLATGRTVEFSLNDENATSLSQKNKSGSLRIKTIDENVKIAAQKSSSFGAKSLSNSNLPKTPMVQLGSTSKRRALGDISNRKHDESLSTVDMRKEKKSSKANALVKSSQTPFINSTDLHLPVMHDVKSIDKSKQKRINGPKASANYSQFTENVTSILPTNKLDDDDEIERPAGRTWNEERDHINESYLSDGSFEFINMHEMANNMYNKLIQRNAMEYDRKLKELVTAYDREIELLFEQQSFSDDASLNQCYKYGREEESTCNSEAIFDFEDKWICVLPTDDLSA